MVNQAKLRMQLTESTFPFSKRMLNFFHSLEIYTVAQLTEIPLSKFSCFRGFKKKCYSELLAFIEYEQIERFFTDDTSSR